MAYFKTFGTPNLNKGRILIKNNTAPLASPIPVRDEYVNNITYIIKSYGTLKSTFTPNQFAPYSDTITIYIEGKIDGENRSFISDDNNNWLDVNSFEIVNDFSIPINSLLVFNTNLSTISFNNATIQKFIYNRKITLDKVLLIEDILSSQTNTIGILAQNAVFIPDGSDKIMRNANINQNNRIDYNLGYTPKTFTAIFDYKAGGGGGADGGYFYFFAKGKGDGDLDFPCGKYCNFNSDAYRIHFDEYPSNEQLAVSWGGYQGDCPTQDIIKSVGTGQDNNLGINFGDNTWRTIKIHFDHGIFRIYINNILSLECSDPEYNSRDKTGNYFGLGGYVGGVFNYHSFKNFKFYKIII